MTEIEQMRQEMLLRILQGTIYAVKGSTLTWVELDRNLTLIANAIQAIFTGNSSAFAPYNPSLEYTLTNPATYASYNGNVWKFVSSTPRTGVTPGTNTAVWELTSTGQFAHQQGSDLTLGLGTTNVVTAADLKIIVTEYRKFYRGTNPPGNAQNLSERYQVGSFGMTDAKSIFFCTYSDNTTATWELIFGSGD